MTSLKNYQRKINQYKINRLNYGDLYICGNDIRCGTCLEVGLDCNDTYKKLKPLITDKFITNLIITKKEKIVSSHYISYYN